MTAPEARSPAASFELANLALARGNYLEAIRGYEELADLGQSDPALSFNRGLAYAGKLSLSQTEASDLGQAIAGFEEARLTTESTELREKASAALLKLRDYQSRTQHSAVVHTDDMVRESLLQVPEDAWSVLLLLSSAFAFGIALLIRARRPKPARRVLTLPLFATLLVWTVALFATAFGRYDRGLGDDAITLKPLSASGLSAEVGTRVRALHRSGTRTRVRLPGYDDEIQTDSSALRILRLKEPVRHDP
jgi:tetratricopeptide (TPR) repeat protein